MQRGLLLLVFHESKPATCLLSPEFNMLPPEEGTEKSQGQQPKYRQCPCATYIPVSSSRYRSQLLRKVLIGFWTMKSGSVIFHWLRSTLPQLASPALYFRVLILVKCILWASWFYLGLFSRRVWLDTWLEDMRRGEVRVFLPSLSLLPVAPLATAEHPLELQRSPGRPSRGSQLPEGSHHCGFLPLSTQLQDESAFLQFPISSCLFAPLAF